MPQNSTSVNFPRPAKNVSVAVQWHTFTTGEIIREESEIMMRSFCRRNLKGGKSSLCIQKWFAFLLQLKTFAWPPFKRRKQRFSLTTFCTGRPNSWLSEMSRTLMKWFLPYTVSKITQKISFFNNFLKIWFWEKKLNFSKYWLDGVFD